MLKLCMLLLSLVLMPFTAIEESKQEFSDVPFLNDWNSKKKNDGTIFAVLSIYQSDKGLVLTTHQFKVFIWKSESLFTSILEKVGSSLNPDQQYDSLAVKPIAAIKKGFSVGWNDSYQGHWSEQGRNLQFIPSMTVPSATQEELEVGKPTVDTSPQNGRKAR